MAALALAFAGCGGGSSESTAASESARSEAEFEAEVGTTIDVSDAPPPKRLVIEDLNKGSGAVAKDGDEVEYEYVSALYSTGEVTSVAKPYAPFHLELGAEGGIRDWENGILGMRIGGRRELIIPPESSSEGGRPAEILLVKLVGIK